ncbi:isoprenyl transferase [Truepera radiovictrix]|uniref:Isoprenyl transferase n=1 Tax=Truepera radiovictrix (strain DSM 17093 / CIP 108686 / LMG 22925 / RQ-24) TaxID=649638 RepID=D7CVQ8_TRURR|nr:undecaprenyl diphosphate synthase [Truepera radiovictrix DSM 17093]
MPNDPDGMPGAPAALPRRPEAAPYQKTATAVTLEGVAAPPHHPALHRALSLWKALTAPLYWLYEERLERSVRSGSLPRHIGLIMDGNRRFARSVGLDVTAGHDYGAGKAREVLEWCFELGIPHVTLWGFSTDNRGRAQSEVSHLHSLFARQAKEMVQDPKIHRNRVRVRVIGDIGDFPPEVQAALREVERATEHYDKMQLNVAVGYGGREEIVAAVRNLLRDEAHAHLRPAELAERVSADTIGQHLYTAGVPDPDFIIRTSGEVRLSGFLLWQAAYSEYYFCDAFWPSFRKVDFLRALRSYQARERRFGK